MKQKHSRRILRAVGNYAVFFALVAYVVTCTTALFVAVLSKTLETPFTKADLNLAAKLTFANVVLLSILFFVIDTVRRKLTVERITKKIAEGAKQMAAGNFDVRISPGLRVGADEQFGEIIHCFNQMAEELSGVETLRTDFISNVSHEMKTPLAVIRNYGTLLSAPELSDERRMEYAKGITDASCRLSDMVTNILKLDRLENQQIYPNAETYDLGEQLRESLLLFESCWEERRIHVEPEIPDGVTVCADAELLSLIWNNLLSNAFKFTEPGGTVALRLSTEGECAVVKVSDTGCGISPEVGAHIFEKFYQGDTSHAAQGNGLGLALVKRVTDIVHGTIGVESVPGRGSIFTVKIRRNLDDVLEKTR